MSEWKKVKIGDVCKIVKGTTGIASAVPGEFPLVVTAVERKTCSTYQFDCEAVCIPLVSSSGHGKKSLNNVHYQSGKFALGTILCAVIPNNPDELDARYLHQYLQFYKDTVLVPLMKGAANVSLSMKDIAGVSIPLPPIQRQRELAEMFVTLQEKQKELFTEFEKQTEYAKQLRQNILQEAIEGKLTADWRKQHPVQKGNPDYDAEALFEKIQAEKLETKSTKKTVAPIAKDEIPFEIPTNWKWVRLGEICSKIGSGSTPLGSDYCENGIPFFRSQNVYNEGLEFKDIVFISSSMQKKMKGTIVRPNDLLLNITGGSLGRCAVVSENIKEGNVSQHVCIIRPLLTNHLHLHLFVLSELFQKNIKTSGAGRQGLPKYNLERMLVPLPPLAEQKEIVARVEQHLQTIIQLETQIATRETTTKQLMQSILKDAFVG
ncbi:restriction endonuclease subunit S [Fibrobacter sp.]|uniref:restriction endonuclease subunit S n=1 Tax=Fibrobacter sp. TaxID=35828 RepID=UPI0025C27BA9|nr:restriction endonuclease subunit S [Fibrobacter sp.]MBR3072250.1 restriction endonuclease subunit S [Fibrobacter sp.]